MGNYAGNYGGQLGDAHNLSPFSMRTSTQPGTKDTLFRKYVCGNRFIKVLRFAAAWAESVTDKHDLSFSYPTYEDQENTLTNNLAKIRLLRTPGMDQYAAVQQGVRQCP